MTAHSPIVVTEFYQLCNWAYEAWRTHRVLFDESSRTALLQSSPASDALHRLSKITQEYVLHQISKLHDPAVQRGQANLGIEYMVNFGGWDQSTQVRLSALQIRLEQLALKLRAVRNKRLSHNDLATILNSVTLGTFPKEMDFDYFQVLQEFVDIVHAEVIGYPRAFDDLVDNDAVALLHAIKSGNERDV